MLKINFSQRKRVILILLSVTSYLDKSVLLGLALNSISVVNSKKNLQAIGNTTTKTVY